MRFAGVTMPEFTWLTPAAPAAIAIVQCDADQAVIEAPLPAVGRACFSHIKHGDGRLVDEVVVLRITEQLLELQCHGGVGIRAAVSDALISHGLSENAQGKTDQTWSDYARIAHTAALPLMDSSERHELWFRQPLVLITGPANAGKSTLLNAWCGHQRAIVSEHAGTTRDLLAAIAEIHGWQLQLIDSAGLREGAGDLEQAGQDLVNKARTWVDAVIYLSPHADALNYAQAGDIVVQSKWDLRGDGDSTKGLVWSAPDYSDLQTAQQQLYEIGQTVLDHLSLPWSLPTEDDK